VEIWKPIKCVNGKYEVSNMGKVRNSKGKLLKPYMNGGYLRVNLYYEGKPVRKLVHVLVAEVFICEKPFRNAQVNHIDEVKTNNCADNLEWTTPKQNVNHSLDKNRRDYLKKEMSKIGKKYGHTGVEATKKKVAQLDLDGNILCIFESAREASRETGSNYKHISSVCRGQRKTHNGFKWKFVG